MPPRTRSSCINNRRSSKTQSARIKKPAPVKEKPLVAPDGSMFFPCKFCTKIFPLKTTRNSHMKTCVKNRHVKKSLNKSVNNYNRQRRKLNETIDSDSLDVKSLKTENNLNGERDIIAQIIKDFSTDENLDEENEEQFYIQREDLKEAFAEEEQKYNESKKQCNHCEEIFENPLDLLRHNRQCHVFPKTLLSQEEIEKYYDYPNKSFCPICNKPIKSRNFRSIFIKHLQVHVPGLLYECRICKRRFRRRDHMRTHEKRHIVSS